MKRFVIRNYGATRQLPFKGQNIFIANEEVKETDDEEMARALAEYDFITMTDRGTEEKVHPVEEPEDDISLEPVAEEIDYADMTLPELRELAKARPEMNTKGLRKKADFINAHKAYDSEHVDEPEVPEADIDEPEESTDDDDDDSVLDEPDVSEEPVVQDADDDDDDIDEEDE